MKVREPESLVEEFILRLRVSEPGSNLHKPLVRRPLSWECNGCSRVGKEAEFALLHLFVLFTGIPDRTVFFTGPIAANTIVFSRKVSTDTPFAGQYLTRIMALP